MRVAARPRPRRRFSALARGLAAAALLLLAAVVALRLRAPQEQAGPPPAADEAARLSAHMRARALLLRRDGARLVFIITTQASRDAACALAAAAGELLSPTQCPGRGSGSSSGAASLSQGSDDAAWQCRALRSSPYTALVLEAARLPSPPFHDARARYVALLDDVSMPPGKHINKQRSLLAAPVWPQVLETADAVLRRSQLVQEGLPALARLAGWRLAATDADTALNEAQTVSIGDDGDVMDAQVTRRAAQLVAEDAESSVQRRKQARMGRFADSASRPCSELPGAALPAGPVPPGSGADAPGGSCGASGGSRDSVALCASLRDAAPFLAEWLSFHAAAGATRAYLHDDGSGDGTAAALETWAQPHSAARGFVTPLTPLHGPPRFGVAQRTPAGGWSGQREILSRCLTHAMLDGVCWLINADLDEYAVPREPHDSLAAALAPHSAAVCATVRRHAFNSNNASSEVLLPLMSRMDADAALPSALVASSAVARTFVRRWRVFPPVGRGMPRNPKWALRVPAAAAALAARGPHALALQVHNIWDRASCARCADVAELSADGLVPEVDPCAGYYARADVKAAPEGRCTRNWCTGDTGAVAENTLKLHHYVLPRGAKSYRRKGAGDAGAKRDVWTDDVRDGDALRFAP